MFEVGKKYRRVDGVIVTIVKDNSVRKPNDPEWWPKGYECVQGDDPSEYSPTGEGIWRYNRPGDYGRCCGGPDENPHNLLPGAVDA
ncbi:MAG: hypothetical protein EOP83_29550 [Verrucomicrobiaceae bacterium]|nr:MAG: hypothetical protein EOP83_29550 [Verrucomicrobiaceae bacterium]